MNAVALLLLKFLSFFVTATLANPTSAPLFTECGRVANAALRIVGGEEVGNNTWPWMVSISTMSTSQDGNSTGRKQHNCGGVLINREWVLTAAHCLDNQNQSNVFPIRPPSSWRVTAGMHSRNFNTSETSRWQERGVSRFFYHPQFQDLTYTAYNDIALLRLDSPVEFNANVRPICLPRRRSTEPGWNRCYAAGWGTTSEEGDYFSLTLREVEIPVVNSVACKSRYGESYKAKQHLCGGDWFNGNKDSCKGDSGGPLACQLDDGSWYVAGIISWGMGCGRQFTPGIYTNVMNYERWILPILIYYSQENPRLLQRGFLKTRSSSTGERSLVNRLLSNQ